MIGFIIPIKPKRFSKDWNHDALLLERTVRSILQQTDQRFKIFIVYNDKPEIKLKHDSINWIFFDFDFIETKDISDYDSFAKKWYKHDYARKMFDKGRKITFGCKYAKEADCKYIMAVDSDDLISNQICAFVNNSPAESPGWVIRKGYMHLEETRFLLKNKEIQNINGSTHIIREDFVRIPDMNSRMFIDFNFFESHGYVFQRMIDEHNIKLSTIPFYGTMYIIHKNNSSEIREILSLKKLKTLVKLIVYGKLLNKNLRKEFGLYPIKIINGA